MSYDSYSIVYHLTPQGWQVERDDGYLPTDRLLTAELQVYQGSGFGRESRHWKTVWTSPGLSAEEIATLETRFPKPKQSTELSEETLLKLLEKLGGDK